MHQTAPARWPLLVTYGLIVVGALNGVLHRDAPLGILMLPFAFNVGWAQFASL